ncbi:Disease resistance protein L6 [Linum grandiflorum]
MMGSDSSSSVSPTSPVLPTGDYEVFLSFRGPDVRQNFADCLYSCLVRAKIRTFRDEEELPKGETLGPSLVKAITQSKVYIPILSENYASSKWCLQELAKMVECWKTGKGHLILPIFYLVDPHNVRHQDAGSYKKAFKQHSKKHDPQTVMEWSNALQEVGKMKGWHVTKADGLGAVIDHVFTKVELHLRANYKLVTDQLVGIDCHVEKVIELLDLSSATSENIVGIHGMGGLGKSTLAKAVYNKVSTQFHRCCFLENVTETLLQSDGIVALQNKIISNILKNDSQKAKDASDGIRIIKDRVCMHKVLIVLDDLDERFQFGDILGNLSDFSGESRFLITTRYPRVLELLPECKSYELGEMGYDHALELFSTHAFKADHPPEDYAALSKEYVQVAAGLPLALKVIGSLLFRTSKQFWEAKLKELKEIPPSKVQERLRISYNDLTYNERQIFLDVACLFVGANKELPIYMWSDRDFYPESTIVALAQRSLLRITESNEFWMHDHIRNLGRAIVREEDIKNAHKRSRVWSNKDAINMLMDGEGTDCVEALRVDMEDEEHELTTHEFKNLSGLRYLEVRNGNLTGDFKEVLPNLCWLRLYCCDQVPTDLNLKKSVILGLEDCPLNDEWRGWNDIKVARKLKVLNLSRSYGFKGVPDLASCRGLELLDISECEKMDGELDIRHFKNLKVLQASKTKITRLRDEIGMLHNLEKLDLSFSSLVTMPVGMSKLTSLESLDLILSHPNKPQLRETLPDSLKSLSISSFSFPALPSSLSYLELRYCEQMQRMPSLGSLSMLTQLDMDKVGIREIPGLGELKVLATLRIADARNLSNLNGLENLLLLEELSLEHCPVLRELPSLANLAKLYKLEIGVCKLLTELNGVEKLGESLSHLKIRDCSGLRDMKVLLPYMVKLETLTLMGFAVGELLPHSISMFTKLRSLSVVETLCLDEDEDVDEDENEDEDEEHENEMPFKEFPDVSNLTNLRELVVRCCSELIEVPGLERLVSLEALRIEGCDSIRKLPDLSGLKLLKKLNVSGCSQLTDIKGLTALESLEDLNIRRCKLMKLPNLSGLKKLRLLNHNKYRN